MSAAVSAGRADALRAALAGGPVVVPGCHDPLSARQAAAAGARAVFLSGGTVGRALFDAPLIPRTEAQTYLRYVRHVCASSPVPVLVDGEDGFGDPTATCAQLVDAGAAGVIVGDSLPDGSLLPVAAVTAMIDEIRDRFDLVLVPRADGLAQDRADTCDRLRRYAAAGAELLIVLLNSVLRTESRDELLVTFAELATASAGRLIVHSRLGDELPPVRQLPPGVQAAVVSAISVPSTDRLTRLLAQD